MSGLLTSDRQRNFRRDLLYFVCVCVTPRAGWMKQKETKKRSFLFPSFCRLLHYVSSSRLLKKNDSASSVPGALSRERRFSVCNLFSAASHRTLSVVRLVGSAYIHIGGAHLYITRRRVYRSVLVTYNIIYYCVYV